MAGMADAVTGRAIWIATAAALVPSLASHAARAQEIKAAPAFVVPTKPMVMTRTLRRPLSDGREVVSLRSYLLQFRAEGDRIRVDGLLLAVTVDAPPVLGPLMEMERRRGDEGMFPMWLDRAGMLLPRAAAPPDPAREQALARTASRVGAFKLTPAEEAQARAFVGAVRQGGTGSTAWPSDLFQPDAGGRSDVRALELPDGGEGRVTVEMNATRADGILASYTRRTTTDIAGDRRIVDEEWTLVPAP